MGRGALACGRKGFTLVEVMVAMGVLSFILLGLAAVAGTGHISIQANRQRLRAIHLADNMLENLVSPAIVSAVDPPTIFSYDEVRTDDPGSFPAGDVLCGPWRNDIANQLGANARGEIAVTANTPRAGRTLIAVTVFWRTRSGETQVSVTGVR